MKPTELGKIASAAYGPDWKTPLGREIDVTREMVWRYATGRTPIPDYLVAPIRRACQRMIKRRIAKLEKVLATIGNVA